MKNEYEVLSEEEILTFYEKSMELLKKNYVFPDVAEQVCLKLTEQKENMNFEGGIYRTEFKKIVEQTLQSINKDKHLHIFYQEENRTAISAENTIDHYRLKAEKTNYGFHRIERLPGNIGYLDLRVFYENDIASETAVNAMNAIAHTDALIIDLRENIGGSPHMVAFLASYFLNEPTHIDTFYRRDEDSKSQIWTLPYVPGILYGDKPVYILTSKKTFSAGELFSYAFKHLKRAKIIGEWTGGGANPGNYHQATKHIQLFIPSGRSISPFTTANWEGTGVEPDLNVPAGQAFEIAYENALKTVEQLYETREGFDFLMEEIKEAREKNPRVELM